MEWINRKSQSIDYERVAFILTEDDRVVPFTNDVNIFDHSSALYDLLTAKAWLPFPLPPPKD